MPPILGQNHVAILPLTIIQFIQALIRSCACYPSMGVITMDIVDMLVRSLYHGEMGIARRGMVVP